MGAVDATPAVPGAKCGTPANFPPVRAHRVLLFFPFRIGRKERRPGDLSLFADHLESARIADLTNTKLLPSWLRESVDTADTAVWRPCKRGRTVSLDLHPHVRRLAGYGSEPEPTITHPRVFELTPEAVNILTGRFGSRGRGLLFQLTRASARRLGEESRADEYGDHLCASILIEGATVEFWHTRIGLLVEVSVQIAGR